MTRAHLSSLFVLAVACTTGYTGEPQTSAADAAPAATDAGRGTSADAGRQADVDAGTAAPNACNGIDFAGFCSADGTAVWCEDDRVNTQACAGAGLSCEVGTCFSGGAACCPHPACAAVPAGGACVGETVRQCTAGALSETDCAASGTSCQLDVCGDGAACCTAEQVAAKCTALGVEGACVAGNTAVQFCIDGVVERDVCASGQTCKLDDCLPGWAGCCP